MQKAREFKEGSVESEMLRLLHTLIEEAKPVEFKMLLDNIQLQIVKDDRMFPEKAPPEVLPKVQGVTPEWNSKELEKKVDGFFEAF